MQGRRNGGRKQGGGGCPPPRFGLKWKENLFDQKSLCTAMLAPSQGFHTFRQPWYIYTTYVAVQIRITHASNTIM